MHCCNFCLKITAKAEESFRAAVGHDQLFYSDCFSSVSAGAVSRQKCKPEGMQDTEQSHLS